MPYTKTETEDAIYQAIRDVWPTFNATLKLYPELQGSGRKTEPYGRIYGARSVSTMKAFDTGHKSQSATEHKVDLSNTRQRVRGCAIDCYGPEAHEHAQTIADKLQSPTGRAAMYSNGVPLQGQIDGPIDLPYTEENKRKLRSRLEFEVMVEQTEVTQVDQIEYLEISSPQLGIPVETVDLTGGS